MQELSVNCSVNESSSSQQFEELCDAFAREVTLSFVSVHQYDMFASELEQF